MGKINLNLKGSENKTYNLDEIASETRTNSSQKLIVQVWEYDPKTQSPNPPDLQIGQIWIPSDTLVSVQ